MDKITELIQQAKPLYKQRKRRKKIATLLLSITLPLYIATNLATLYIEGDAIYMSFDNNNIQSQLLSDEYDILGLE